MAPLHCLGSSEPWRLRQLRSWSHFTPLFHEEPQETDDFTDEES